MDDSSITSYWELLLDEIKETILDQCDLLRQFLNNRLSKEQITKHAHQIWILAIKFNYPGSLKDIVKVLLGANGVDKTFYHNEAFRMACKNGHIAIVELLLGYSEVNAAVFNNEAICMASNNGHLNVVKLLLKFPGVDPAARDNKPIQNPSENGHYEIVKLLLGIQGVDATAKDNLALN
ncbi:hypothetical protein HDU76_010353 [Blyttiomyces sp. JEL0837]|nr:hypothetical protein HDU76_010353 [Blyttiomyces sp. JEL0837]